MNANMKAPLPYLDRLQSILDDVPSEGLVIDINWNESGQKLSKKNINISSVNFATEKASILHIIRECGSPNLVLLRGVWPDAVRENVLAEINLALDQETPLVVVEEVLDPFNDYAGLSERFETQFFPVDRPLLFSPKIEAELKSNGFTPQSVERFRLEWCYSFDRWIDREEMLRFKKLKSGRSLFKKLPKFVLDEIGIKRSSGGTKIYFPHEWVIFITYKSDVARHRVSAVASALIRRNVGGKYCLLVQKRHREADFWESWEVPQGHILPGESFEEAASRELQEETGVAGRVCNAQPFVKRSLGARAYSAVCGYTKIDQLPPKEFFAVGVWFDYVDGEPTSVEDRQFMWASPVELKDLLTEKKIFPLNEEMIRQFIEINLASQFRIQ
jgi:8-oxo-dGTP pyrophosphatase MutT (NUDIX family)